MTRSHYLRQRRGTYARFAQDMADALEDFGHLPSRFTSEGHPNLVASKATIDTIAVGAILTLYNFEPDSSRYELTARFAQKLLFNLDKMKAGAGGLYHTKWSEVDPAARVPGWVRFKPVEVLLSSR